MASKVCNKCNQLKKYTEYHKKKQNKDGYSGKCKVCTNTYMKTTTDYIENAPMRSKSASVRRQFNIDLSTYTEIMNQSGTHCPLCSSEYTEGKTTHAKVLDHCHKTGNIRGVICQACNKALGCAKDDTTTLTNMIRWLS